MNIFFASKQLLAILMEGYSKTTAPIVYTDFLKLNLNKFFRLSFTYSVSCAGGISKDGRRLMGPGCDLNCNTTSITTNNAICENVKTGYFSQCKWTNGGNLDVNILYLIKNI